MPGAIPLRLPALAELYNYELVRAFPHRFDQPVMMVPFEGLIYVAEVGGRVFAFDPKDPGAGKQLVLDLSDHTIAKKDSGLLGIALRPGELFVYYAFVEAPVDKVDDPEFTHHARLARFELADGRADMASERILISLRDRHLFHQGGGMFFHPEDGFLYLSIGDEGRFNCELKTCQKIDQSLFGGVLRIDVDERGGEVSHPIVRQPDNGETQHYFVPNDNPFVGDEGVLEEFYALGLRNPHRMTYDPGDQLVWIGDVGENRREEIDVLRSGANFQWDFREGDRPKREEPQDFKRIGVWTDPVWVPSHDDVRVVIGGHVYRGAAMPELRGQYLFAAYRAGTVWAVQYHMAGEDVRVDDARKLLETELQGGGSGIVSFALDEDGELYVLHRGEGVRIQRLQSRGALPETVPRTLSETGLFVDVKKLQLQEAFREYQVNAPLWSDGARKRRFVAVPEGSPAQLDAQDPTQLPPGTLLIKHFSMQMREGDPESERHLETRVISVQSKGVRAVTYRWNEAQDDAELVTFQQEQRLEREGADGQPFEQTYVYPSPGECRTCHHDGAGDALGFRLAQLADGAGDEDQLAELHAAGVIERVGPVDSDKRLYGLHDDNATVEQRVRSYLDANCAFCHGHSEIRGASWDGRLSLSLAETGLVNGAIHGGDATAEDPEMRLIRPGNPEASLLFRRVGSEEPALRMPPLGSSQVDKDFLDLLQTWIADLE